MSGSASEFTTISWRARTIRSTVVSHVRSSVGVVACTATSPDRLPGPGGDCADSAAAAVADATATTARSRKNLEPDALIVEASPEAAWVVTSGRWLGDRGPKLSRTRSRCFHA